MKRLGRLIAMVAGAALLAGAGWYVREYVQQRRDRSARQERARARAAADLRQAHEREQDRENERAQQEARKPRVLYPDERK
jgi:uncharacterized protein HemX